MKTRNFLLPGRSLTLPAVHGSQNEYRIKKLPVSAELYLPLLDALGNACTTVVTIGTQVQRGQLLAIANDGNLCGLHAPADAVFSEIRYCPVGAQGDTAPCMLLKTDHTHHNNSNDGHNNSHNNSHTDNYQANPAPVSTSDDSRWKQLSPGELRTQLHRAGFGADWPAGKIDVVLLDLMAFEPWQQSASALLQMHTTAVLNGSLAISHAMQARTLRIAVTWHLTEGLQQLQDSLRNTQGIDIELIRVQGGYPAYLGDAALKRLTQTTQWLRLNAATAFSCHHYLTSDEPRIQHIIAISGTAPDKPQLIQAALGTPYRDILHAIAPNIADDTRLMIDGPLHGTALASAMVPVQTRHECLFVDTRTSPRQLPAESACTRCGECIDICPQPLAPLDLLTRLRINDLDGAQQNGLNDCINCGACTYVCPSHIPLQTLFLQAQIEWQQQQHAQQQADTARKRFNAHQQRIQQQEEDKRRRHDARKTEVPSAPCPAPDPALAMPATEVDFVGQIKKLKLAAAIAHNDARKAVNQLERAKNQDAGSQNSEAGEDILVLQEKADALTAKASAIENELSQMQTQQQRAQDV